MRLAVVILNWNGRLLLEKFLPSVVNTLPDYAAVFIIDNASSDDSVSFVKQNFPDVEVIRNAGNFGFAKGYNEGLKKIKAAYFVLLNSDVEVTPAWIQPIVDRMDGDRSIGACQPKLLNYNMRDEFEYAGGAGGYIDKWCYPFCRGRIFNSFEKDTGQYNDAAEIFWASGACLFIRSELYAQAGGLDEDFFAHMEEIDLCWRIRNQGYRIVYEPSSAVYHVGAGTLAKMNPRKTYYNFRNSLLLMCKNHAPEYFFIKFLLRGSLDGIAGIKFLLSGELGHFIAVIKAHFGFYRLLPATLRKRRVIQKTIARYATGCVYKGSIVWEYFVLGKRKFSDLRKDLF